MFSNFIYFIVVLLIYSTYQPSENTNFTGSETLFLFVCLIVIFAAITWIQFHRVEKQILKQQPFPSRPQIQIYINPPIHIGDLTLFN